MTTADNSRLTLSYLRFFAALLITNSHIGPLYPPSLQVLSTGGALGNSLFFFCSGFALYLSNRNIGFYPWIIRRFTRIYPSLWIFMLACYSLGIERYNIIDIIVPTFWFLQAILVFYILFFYTVKHFDKHLGKIGVLMIFPLLITYFSMKNNGWVIENVERNHFLHWYFYYAIMLLGAFTARKKQWLQNKLKIGYTLIFLIAILTIYYGLKIYILHTSNPIYCLQLILPIFLAAFAYYTFKFCQWLALHIKIKSIKAVVPFVANLTLDIYIVQFVIMGYFAQYKFPYGFVGALIAIFLAATLLHKVSDYATKYLRRWLL